MNSVIRLHPDDDVGIARVPLAVGSVVWHGVRVVEEIAPGHKVALRDIAPGAVVRRYGEIIGRAAAAIGAGSHVHLHNLVCDETGVEQALPSGERPLPRRATSPVFLGYAREDGRAGTRNYIAVVAASNCAAHTAQAIARTFEGEALPENVDGVVAFPHGDGCGHAIGPDSALLRRTIAGVLDHPNVSAALIVGLGCETNQVEQYGAGPRLHPLTLQACGGTRATVEAARRQIRVFIERAAAERRVGIPASRLVLGLNCGGSDSFSGITANPALGVASDLLAALGGTPVLAETPEIVGAEHLLVRRARNPEVALRVLGYIRAYRAYLARFGESFDDNPSPGNKAGGLTNIVEKSLGAVSKGGSAMLSDAVDYAERITSPGLVFMNTPGYDPVSLAGLAAGGCNLIVFTTGRGSAIGFPTVPVIKVASNSAMFQRMRDNMDVNAGERSVEETGRAIFDLLLRVASGERTAAERLGHHEFVPWRIGPVM